MNAVLLFAISIVSILSYVLYIVIRYGVQRSISESYYKLPRNKQWMFTLALWGYAIPMVILAENVLLFLAGAAICFTGAAPAFKKSDAFWVHNIGVIVGIILGAAYVIIFTPFYGLMILMTSIIFTIQIYHEDNFVLWQECTAIIFISGSLILDYIF